MTTNKRPHHEVVAETIIGQLKEGTAPWLKPWSGANHNLPHNPISGSRYRGANLIWLSAVEMEKRYGDSRWMTYKQGQTVGAQVKRGEKGTLVEYWKFSDRRKLKDEKGKDLIGKDGKPIYEEYKLQRPQRFSAVVFNASQFDNMSEAVAKTVDFKANERAEKILQNSGAKIFHDQHDRAYYSSLKDEIHLPAKDQFNDETTYYATALHELGHWTGHSSRLGRELGTGFGTVEYAKEELRAEISSMMMGAELGIGHDPGQHVSYIASWIKVLEEDPKELFRASADAEKILGHVMGYEKEKSIERTPNVEREPIRPALQNAYINVPYKEKDEAKRLGARWDKKERSWYVPKGADLEKFSRWQDSKGIELSPKEQFKTALSNAGLNVESPIMDGKFHRVPAIDDGPGKKSGSYKAYLDGHPAGYIENFKTGAKINWKADGTYHTDKSLSDLRKENMTKRRLREIEAKKVLEIKSAEFTKYLETLGHHDSHPYLEGKGHTASHYQDKENNIVLPIHDLNGKVYGLQRISSNGFKQIEEGSQLTENFYSLEPFDPQKKTYITEGYATALSIRKAVGMDSNIVCVFSSNNIKAVAKVIAGVQKAREITICGDDDYKTKIKLESLGKTPINPGKKAAIEAAEEIGAVAVFPRFTKEEKLKGLTDFNDFEKSRGLSELRSQLHQTIDHKKGVSL